MLEQFSVLIFAVLNKEGLAGTENVVHRKIRGNFSVKGLSLGNSVIESELSEEDRVRSYQRAEMNIIYLQTVVASGLVQ